MELCSVEVKNQVILKFFGSSEFFVQIRLKMAESQAEFASSDFTDRFWLSIEKSLGCIVPKYIQHILRYRGYDNAASVGTLSSNDIKAIESFFKTKLKKDAQKCADQNGNIKKFFHEFHDNNDEFEILPGHFRLIEKIVFHINSMTEKHGPEFFNPHLEANNGKLRVATIRGRGRGRGPQILSQTLAKSAFVGTRIQTTQAMMAACMKPTSGEPHSSSVTASCTPLINAQPFDPQNSLCTDSIPEEPVDTHADKHETAENIETDGSLEKFIMEERVHLSEVLRGWMKDNVPVFFEQYSDKLVPDIWEVVMEKSKCVTGNEAENKNLNDNRDVDSEDLMILVFKFSCPKCDIDIRSTQQPSKNGESSYFSLSNVQRHWKIHEEKDKDNKSKKSKDKKNSIRKPEARKLRSKAIDCDVKKEFSCLSDEFEVVTDGDSDGEGPGDFKIVKRKVPSRKN